jgi:glucose/arabinose dehydrogenase
VQQADREGNRDADRENGNTHDIRSRAPSAPSVVPRFGTGVSPAATRRVSARPELRKRLCASAAAGAIAILPGVVTVAATAGRAAASRFVPYASGFASPVYVTSAPTDPTTLYVVEQAGVIEIVENGRIAGTFLDIRPLVTSGGERGLLSMAFSPKYATNHLFYVSYDDRKGNSRIVQYRSANGVGIEASATTILTVRQPYRNHKGGQLQFDTRGYLYAGFGDGGSEGDPDQTAQNPGLRLGKLLRSATTSPNGVWKTVGLGLRNPWRFSFDTQDNLWIGDVGQDHWEEVDFRPAARLDTLANYGWSRYEGDVVYSAVHRYTNVGEKVFPVLVYPHSVGCSITGGYVHAGRYYYGDYCSGTIWSFPVGPRGPAGPSGAVGNVPSISSFGVDGAGHLYAASLSGTLYRLG